MPSSSDLRLVLVVPATNTTMEPELHAYWPGIGEVWRVGVTRKRGGPILADELPEYRDTTLRLVAPLAGRKPDLVLYGCTTAGFLSGPDGDAEMADALTDATGAPTVTTATAMVQALRESGVQRPGVVTPYLDATNEGLKKFLAALDMPVPVLESFRCAAIEDYDRVPAGQLRDRAVQVGRHRDVDGVFIACTQLRTLGVLEPVRKALGKPAWGAVEATAWAAKRKLKLAEAKS